MIGVALLALCAVVLAVLLSRLRRTDPEAAASLRLDELGIYRAMQSMRTIRFVYDPSVRIRDPVSARLRHICQLSYAIAAAWVLIPLGVVVGSWFIPALERWAEMLAIR